MGGNIIEDIEDLNVFVSCSNINIIFRNVVLRDIDGVVVMYKR